MIYKGETRCPKCNGELNKFDSVNRIVRSKNHQKIFIRISRMKCVQCGSTHRVLPKYLYPYKHYERDIIDGVCEGLITSDTLGFEDYPCEMTLFRWKTQIQYQKMPGEDF